MKTVQMTLDDDLVKQVDVAIKKLHTNRSAFTREALRDALNRLDTLQLEQQHLKGYQKKPVTKTEFSVWEDEQDWGEV